MNENWEKDFEDMVQNKKFDNIFCFGKCLGYPEKVDKGSIKNVIYGICTLCTEDNSETPLHYMACSDGKRTFAIEDLTKEEAIFLYNKLDKIENTFVKTRIAEVLFRSKKLEGKGKTEAAKIAVCGYYKIIDEFLNKRQFGKAGKYVIGLFHLIKCMKGTKEQKEFPKKLLEYTDVEYQSDDEGFEYYIYYCLDKLSKTNCTDKSILESGYRKTLSIIDDIKERNISSSWIYEDNSFYEVAIELGKKLNLDKCELDNLKAEKAKVLESQDVPNCMYKEPWKKALSIYKSAGKKDDADRLESKINNIKLDLAQFRRLQLDPVNIEDYVKNAKSKISGKSFRDAIFEFINLLYIPDKEEGRKIILNRNSFLFRRLDLEGHTLWGGHTLLDKNGKTVYKPNSFEENIEDLLIDGLEYYYQIFISAVIIPALEIINSEHKFSWEDILKLLENKSFAPASHKKIFAKGIYYFLTKNFLEASHLLILQVEECLRNLLSQKGIMTYHIHENGNEEFRYNIPKLLEDCVKNGIFPENLEWLLEIFLVSKQIGARHRIAHGMQGDAPTIDVIVLCYIVFCLALDYDLTIHKSSDEKISMSHNSDLWIKMINSMINEYERMFVDCLSSSNPKTTIPVDFKTP